MPDVGGSAALNGFLYQFLANLGHIVQLTIKNAERTGDDLRSALLILEPKSGGDAQYLVEGRRIVEQYKTRSAGTWSTRDIVFDVLPDLFRAVDETQPASKYRFVTDGRLGRIGHLQGFLKHFSDSPPTNPLSALDDREKHPYYNSEKKTELEFFRHIACKVKPKRELESEVAIDADYYRKVWHLLGRLEFEEERTASDYEKVINEYLFLVVDHREDIPNKRRELCGLLLELSSRGSVSRSPQEILRQAALDSEPITNFSNLKSRIKEAVREEFERLEYYPEEDVRASPGWTHERSVIVLAGESGQGKTWQLLRLAEEMIDAGKPVAIVQLWGMQRVIFNRRATLFGRGSWLTTGILSWPK